MTALDLGTPSVPPANVGTVTESELARRSDDSRLLDSWGRVATDLRVSLTDRCNLRCVYCMPAEGLDWMPGPEALTDDEVIRLVGIAVERLGVREIRFTGGEPLLRKGLDDIVAASAALTPRPDIALTTNGLGLTRRAHRLADLGLDRVNVSLDTLRPQLFAELTRRDRLHDVLSGLTVARDAGLAPIKINAVLMRGLNDDEAPELLAWALAEGHELRIIEQMPLDPDRRWQREAMVTADEVLASLSTRFTLTEAPASRGGSPAERFTVEGHLGRDGSSATVG